jgi:putative MFS transporter
LDEALAEIGLGWFHVRLWWICGLGFAAAAAEVVLMSFVFPELRRLWHLDEYQLGTLAAVISGGSIFGEPVFGSLADKYGRRLIFMTTLFIVIGFGVASSFAPNVYWLAGMRFFVGFGYGGNIAVDFTMYSEFLPTHGRGNMLFLMGVFWPLGQCFTCLMAWLLIPSYGWQVFVAACALPMMASAFARPFMPESPRWLLTQGRVEEATDVCREMARINGKAATDVGLGDWCQVSLDNENTSVHAGGVKPSIALFSSELCRTTLGLLFIVAALNYTSYGTLTLMPSFLEMKGIPRSNMYVSMVLNALAQLPGIVLASWSAIYLGRLIPFRASMFLVGLALFGFAIASTPANVMVCTMISSCFHEAGWALYHVYVPEIYPTEIRAWATGVLSAGGSVVAMSAPFVSASFLQDKNVIQAILMFSVCSLLAGLAACFLLHVETKDRDLEDFIVPVKTTGGC